MSHCLLTKSLTAVWCNHGKFMSVGWRSPGNLLQFCPSLIEIIRVKRRSKSKVCEQQICVNCEFMVPSVCAVIVFYIELVIRCALNAVTLFLFNGLYNTWIWQHFHSILPNLFSVFLLDVRTACLCVCLFSCGIVSSPTHCRCWCILILHTYSYCCVACHARFFNFIR
jgi:hypothetical protein